MAKRRLAVMACLLCFCFWFMPCYAQAASSADATEPINVEQECSLTLLYACDTTAFTDVSVKLYKVAEVSADFQYTLTPSFASTELTLNGIRSVGEWDVIRSTLEAHICADAIAPDKVAKTDANGQVSFASLKPGLYLALVGSVKQGEVHCFFDSALVALPGLDVDGRWQYQVSATSKSEIIPPAETEDEIPLKVTKLWKGDKKRNSRPASVEVEIFRDGTSYIKVVLSQDNNWSFSWTAKDDGANWTVVERNVPSGYTMTVEERECSFIVTNTFIPPTPDGSQEAPQTGDTSNIMLYVILLITSGSTLIILGMIGKRNAHEKSK